MLKYILALIVIMNGVMYCDAEYINNVGTVLFSALDTGKKRWNTDEIGLLKARRYFQNLLPPPLFVSTLNENYVDLLFNYFREAYTAIKRETDDPYMDRTMTTALSDSIGGYLKVWVLPVTKFAFYGGTISEQNVTTLFEFYDDIKRYLRTNGDGWRKPKTNLFDVSIRSAHPQLPIVTEGRNLDPCDSFVFFEKTSDGFNVPIPHVSWDGGASKLFLPLKNHSIYGMNCSNSSLVLLKYYETAKYCIQRRYPKMLNNFEARFQSWLATEVLPHLGDDDVYLALGGVLTVMNKTQELYNSVLYMYEKKPKLRKKVHVFAFSKKVLIVTLLIVIEVVWCCVALIYACYVKRKKNKVSQVFLSVEQRRPDVAKSCSSQEDYERQPFQESIKETDATSQAEDAAQTNVDTLYVRGRCCNPKCICHPDASDTVTQSVRIVTGDSSATSRPKPHSKKASKTNSSQSVTFSALGRSTSNTAVPNYSSRTVIKAVSVGSDNSLQNKTDRITGKRAKLVKNTNSAKITSLTETRKSKKDSNVPRSKRELRTSEPRLSSRNKVSEVIKSTMFPDITSVVKLDTQSREQSIDTKDFLVSHTIGTQNVPSLINSSKKLNTDLSINNHMRNEGSQCIEAAKTAINTTNTEKTVQSVSFMKKESKSKALSGSYAGFITYTPAANLELVKKETLIIEKPASINEKQSVNLKYTSVSKKRSLHTLGPQTIMEMPRNRNSRHQEFTTYPSQRRVDKSPKDPKSKSSLKIEPKVSTPKRENKMEPFLEEVIRPGSSIAKKRKPAKTDTENKSTRLSIQKEFKDATHLKEPYWEITIDEPQKDVYVDIKGTIKIDSGNVKKSRIPKLSVKRVEPRTTSNTPRTPKAGSLIPQLRKKAVDDLVQTASAERNKLNTTI